MLQMFKPESEITHASQMNAAIADAIVKTRGVTLLRFSDGTPTFNGLVHGCNRWIAPWIDELAPKTRKERK